MSDDATDADARYQERIIMDDRPHVDGLTRGTVVEYDDWQWGVVTEIAEETEPTKVGFVLLDEIGDWIVRQLEDADGCAEHYQAVSTFRDGEHEYWTPAEYIQDDDMWEILGPIHPDARDGEKLVTDGGEEVEAEIEQEEYDPSPPNHRSVNGERVSRIANRDYAGETTVYTVNNSEIFHADRDCHRIPDDAWPAAETLPHVMSSYLDPIRPCTACTMGIEHCADVAVERDGLPEGQLKYFEPGDKRVNTQYTRADDGSWQVSSHTETEVYDD